MTSVSGTSAAIAAAQSTDNNALSKFAENFQDFLTLLTEQLKHQDPLSPMDSTQFTSQLVQFTGVEQGILQNKNLQALINMQSDVQMSTATSYLGKLVDINGGGVQLENSKAKINYSIGTPVAKVTITITDSSGVTVRTASGDTSQGAHTFNWDGRNDTGTLLPDGKYSVNIQGFDGSGNPVAVDTTGSGIVTNVSVVNGEIVLTVGDQKVPLSSVTSVSVPPTT